MTVRIKNKNQSTRASRQIPESKTSSIVGLITNYKRKETFQEESTYEDPHDGKQIYMRVGEEELFIDLEKNEILADLFSDKEMASMVNDLVIDHLKLEANLKLACMHLNNEESAILNLQAKGHDDEKLSSKMDLSLSAIAIHKQNICRRLNRANFDEVLYGVGAKAIYSR